MMMNLKKELIMKKVKGGIMEYKGDYKLTILNLETNTTFTKFIKNEYFLRKFRNKCRFSKKIRIISETKMY